MQINWEQTQNWMFVKGKYLRFSFFFFVWFLQVFFQFSLMVRNECFFPWPSSDELVLRFLHILIYIHKLKSREWCNMKRKSIFHEREKKKKSLKSFFFALSVLCLETRGNFAKSHLNVACVKTIKFIFLWFMFTCNNTSRMNWEWYFHKRAG